MFKSKKSIMQTPVSILAAFLGYLVITVVTVVVPGIMMALFRQIAFNDAMDTIMSSLLAQLGIALLSSVLIYIWLRFLLRKEHADLSCLGLNGKILSSSIGGFLLGVIFILLTVIPLYFSDSYILTYQTPDRETAIILLTGLFNFFTVAFGEEIIFRGYIQYQISKKSLIRGGILSAVLFALFHLINASYSFYSLLYLFIGGLLFTAMRLAADSIFLPMGFHLAWNWMLSSVLGVGSSRAWLHTEVVTYTWWNGGRIGVESSVPGLLLMTLLTGLFTYIYLRQSRLFKKHK